jgi:hypothetical protein
MFSPLLTKASHVSVINHSHNKGSHATGVVSSSSLGAVHIKAPSAAHVLHSLGAFSSIGSTGFG